MANRYWVGGTGNWSDWTNHWALSSGGSPGVLGSELVTNGGFSGSATGWTLEAGWTYGSNNIVCAAPNVTASQAIAITEGYTYHVSINVGAGSGGVQVGVGGAFTNSIDAGTGDTSFDLVAGANGLVEIFSNAFVGAITNVSVKVAPYPTSAENVFIDSSSGFSGGGTLTLDTSGSCLNFLSSVGHAYTIDDPDSIELKVYGSCTLESGITASNFAIDFLTNLSAQTFTTAGVTIYGVSFNALGGEIIMQDDLTVGNYISTSSGTIDFNGHNVTTTYIGND